MAKKRSIILIGVLCLIGFNTFSFGAEGLKDRIVLATIYFKNDSAELNPESENELKKVQTMLEADPAIGLQIEGYGERVGFAESNREISKTRLQAVQQWFLKHSVDPDRLIIKSPGDSPSAAENATLQDHFLARRVDIVQMDLKLPSAYMPSVHFEFEPVVEGKEVTHDFVIQNNGAALLQVQSVRTD
jgi:hypothetical protein